jgi:hypothetical protein
MGWVFTITGKFANCSPNKFGSPIIAEKFLNVMTKPNHKRDNLNSTKGHRGCDRMVVGFTNTCACQD